MISDAAAWPVIDVGQSGQAAVTLFKELVRLAPRIALRLASIMYKLKPGIKQDAARRWALPDRIFFTHGACHFLRADIRSGFWAERIVPAAGFSGNHVFVRNGRVAFDYHSYSCRSRLLTHFTRQHSKVYRSWSYSLERVTFDLLSTKDLNMRKMRGPDQYHGNAVSRAERFLARFRDNHRHVDATDHETRV